VRVLPLADPGVPDVRSPMRFLIWVVKGQRATLTGGMAFGIVWMCGQATVPFVVGRGIDQGITGHSTHALLTWSAVLLGVGIVQAAAGVSRHRFAVANWMTGTFRVEQLLTRQAAHLGASLTERVQLGDIVSSATTDAGYVGNCLDITARLAGSIVSFAAVAVIMLSTSLQLGLVVLIGVPVLMLLIGPLLRPLHHRQTELRASVGKLTNFGADTVAGLRVLRGVGGEREFFTRYQARSQDVRRKGVAVAAVGSVLDAAEVLLPGIFVVLVTWLGARLAIQHKLTVGQLVSFYGYAAFLLAPMRIATEVADKWTRGLVAAKRILRVLDLQPMLEQPPNPVAVPPDADLTDTTSGLTVRPGEFVVVAAAEPSQASALADRLGRYIDPDDGEQVLFGGVPLTAIALDDVRAAILIGDKDPRLFAGSLRDQLDPHRRTGAADIDDAIDAAVAHDAVESVPGGLDGVLDERALGLSGGQRQRIALARALLVDAPILVLDEPTSAVDAYTEARIAETLHAHRAGKTTIVMSTSPLMLGRADRALLLEDNQIVADGRHRELLSRDARYRSVVTRDEESA
jgi:ABC-type multidrug transport system fused ATPase/permease subunit